MVEVVINLSCYNVSNHDHLRGKIQIGNGSSIFKFLMVKQRCELGVVLKHLALQRYPKIN